jgi:uncharacterized protein YegP (UPF0339 family)
MWKFDIYAGAGGKCQWRLVAANGQTFVSSGESFASKGNAREAAEKREAELGWCGGRRVTGTDMAGVAALLRGAAAESNRG